MTDKKFSFMRKPYLNNNGRMYSFSVPTLLKPLIVLGKTYKITIEEIKGKEEHGTSN